MPRSCEVEDFPVVFNINDYSYDPVSGSMVKRRRCANARGQCTTITRLKEVDLDICLEEDGLHYTEDPQGFKVPPSFPYRHPHDVTIVTPYQIEFKAETLLTPYVDGILLFSTLGNRICPSNQTAIKFSGNRFNWEGLIYAPNGHIDMSASDNSSLSGLIVGWTVSLSRLPDHPHLQSTLRPATAAQRGPGFLIRARTRRGTASRAL